MKNFVALKKLFRGAANAFVSAMCLLCVLAVPVFPSHAQEKRVYQTDRFGSIQYHKPGYAILSDGRIIETDSTGTKQYHKPQYKIKDGTVYAADGGSIQYHKPSLSIQSDGKIFQKDRFGNILHHKEHYIQKNDMIYQADQFGSIQYHKPGFKVVTPK